MLSLFRGAFVLRGFCIGGLLFRGLSFRGLLSRGAFVSRGFCQTLVSGLMCGSNTRTNLVGSYNLMKPGKVALMKEVSA